MNRKRPELKCDFVHARRKVIVGGWGDKPDSVRLARRGASQFMCAGQHHPINPLL